jgi:hypothetical protein
MAALRAPPYNLNLKVSSQTLKPMVDEMLGLKVDDLGISRTPFGLELDALQSQLLAMQQESEDTAVQSSSSSLAATSTLGKDFVRQTQEGVFLHTSSEVSSTSTTASSSASSTVSKKRKATEDAGEDTMSTLLKFVAESQISRTKIAEADQLMKSNALMLQALRNRKAELRSDLADITDQNSFQGLETKRKIAAVDTRIDALLGL